MSNKGESSFTQGLILGTIIGGTIGAVTALLLAPKSGAELRKDIADKSHEIYDKTADYLYSAESKFGSAISNTVNEGRVRAQNIINSAKRQAEDILVSAENVLHDAKAKAITAKEGVQEKISTLKNAAKASADAFKKELNSGSEQTYPGM
jgi:gas vesicle protein